MQIEVRVRAKIEKKEEIIRKLEEKGAYFEGKNDSTSWYYGKELFKKKGVQLRVLEYRYPEDEKKIYLTYKEPQKEGSFELREIFGELKRNSKVFERLGFTSRDFTTPIDAEKTFEDNGLEKFLEVNISDEKKYRYGVFEIKTFRIEELSLDLIEIELNVAWEKDIPKAKEEIYTMMKELGISKANEVKKCGMEMVFATL
ncbi:MAG: hypothetical protein ACD_63C00115G0004 [uncultured bacterium]|nr:MAG: hypothetical protein ACD_63C00115G0004 [uncultured bacterium]